MNQPKGISEYEYHFHAMGTDVSAWLWCEREQLAQGAFRSMRRFFARTEARFSRFQSGSELSRLNRSEGKPFSASPRLYELVKLALRWREQTEGVFDPAVLPALIAAGYDRPFDQIVQEKVPEPMGLPTTTGVCCSSNGVRLLPNHQIYLPPGCALDLGGIVKGWAAQQAVNRLGMFGAALVDAGGDIACASPPRTGPWVVTVADPLSDDQDLAVLGLNHEAVATSSRVWRRWKHHGVEAHHLIDPRTGLPAATDVLSVTVVAPRLPDAEIHAKTALILGSVQGLKYLSRLDGVSGMISTEDGQHMMCGGFEEEAYVPAISNFTERFNYV
jgi:thiamine biosynthesis lipoprotein